MKDLFEMLIEDLKNFNELEVIEKVIAILILIYCLMLASMIIGVICAILLYPSECMMMFVIVFVIAIPVIELISYIYNK